MIFSMLSIIASGVVSAQILQGVLVVIDPGHGWLDHGASGETTSGEQVHEHPHVMDVALRLAREVRLTGAKAILTVRDPRHTTPKDIEQGKILPHDGSGAIPGRRCDVIVSSDDCLNARVEVGAAAAKKHRGPVVWISLHFDALSAGLMGARVIGPKYDSMLLAEKVAEAFMVAPDRTLRWADGSEWGPPALRKGDKEHGIREIYVLSQNNEISERILVEIGNFRNPVDLWRIRDPAIREEYSCRIANGIIAWRASELNVKSATRNCLEPRAVTIAGVKIESGVRVKLTDKKKHIVKKGEWPAMIARQYGVELATLIDVNRPLMDVKYRELCERDAGSRRVAGNAFCRRPEDTLLPGWKISVP